MTRKTLKLYIREGKEESKDTRKYNMSLFMRLYFIPIQEINTAAIMKADVTVMLLPILN